MRYSTNLYCSDCKKAHNKRLSFRVYINHYERKKLNRKVHGGKKQIIQKRNINEQ